MGGGRERLALVRPVALDELPLGRGRPGQVERAVLLVLALAGLLVRGGERVAFLGAGNRPAGGRYGMDQLVRGLERAGKARDPVPPVAALPRFARLVLISDFLQPLDRLQERFDRYVALGARGCVMQLLDPAEEMLPYEGRVLFEGMEQEGAALIDNAAACAPATSSSSRRTARPWPRPAGGRAGASPATGPTGRPRPRSSPSSRCSHPGRWADPCST